MTIDSRLHGIFQTLFGPGVTRLSESDSPETIEGWDSMNHLSLMLALEDEFGVRLDAEDVANLVSVGAIQRRLSEAEATSAGSAA